MSDALFTIEDAQDRDMEQVNALADEEGMDLMSSCEGIRVARDAQGGVAGFCRLQDGREGLAYVNPIVVHPSWRGTGLGRALINDAHELAGELRLVARGNVVGFYQSLGFEELPWEDVDLIAASEHCNDCPDFETCNPLPMRLPA